MTTIIVTKRYDDSLLYKGTASGFYYSEITPEDPNKKGPQWNRIDGQWLITNRHVVIEKYENTEFWVDELTFCLREQVGDEIRWLPITLSKAEIKKRIKLHADSTIDVVAIDISDLIKSKLMEGHQNGRYLLTPWALSNQNLPENQALVIDVTSDIIVASYPKAFYDATNKFPVVKSGIVASAWGMNFNGLPMFEIDAQLFPGSSGGLVISKPTNIAMIDGHLNYCPNKQFVFLGIYSGEYTWEENKTNKDGTVEHVPHSYGLGNVWYSYLIPEIIKDGIKCENDNVKSEESK